MPLQVLFVEQASCGTSQPYGKDRQHYEFYLTVFLFRPAHTSKRPSETPSIYLSIHT